MTLEEYRLRKEALDKLAKIVEGVEPKSHSDGPFTEVLATEHLDNQKALVKVLTFVAAQGEEGATSDEVRLWYNPHSNTGRARLNQLYDLGLVEQTGRTRMTVNNRPAIVHVASERVRNLFT